MVKPEHGRSVVSFESEADTQSAPAPKSEGPRVSRLSAPTILLSPQKVRSRRSTLALLSFVKVSTPSLSTAADEGNRVFASIRARARARDRRVDPSGRIKAFNRRPEQSALSVIVRAAWPAGRRRLASAIDQGAGRSELAEKVTW